jgi:hypothetical protein
LDRDNGANSKAAMMFYDEAEENATGIESIVVRGHEANLFSQGNVMTLNGQVVFVKMQQICKGCLRGYISSMGKKHSKIRHENK